MKLCRKATLIFPTQLSSSFALPSEQSNSSSLNAMDLCPRIQKKADLRLGSMTICNQIYNFKVFHAAKDHNHQKITKTFLYPGWLTNCITLLSLPWSLVLGETAVYHNSRCSNLFLFSLLQMLLSQLSGPSALGLFVCLSVCLNRCISRAINFSNHTHDLIQL